MIPGFYKYLKEYFAELTLAQSTILLINNYFINITNGLNIHQVHIRCRNIGKSNFSALFSYYTVKKGDLLFKKKPEK